MGDGSGVLAGVARPCGFRSRAVSDPHPRSVLGPSVRTCEREQSRSPLRPDQEWLHAESASHAIPIVCTGFQCPTCRRGQYGSPDHLGRALKQHTGARYSRLRAFARDRDQVGGRRRSRECAIWRSQPLGGDGPPADHARSLGVARSWRERQRATPAQASGTSRLLTGARFRDREAWTCLPGQEPRTKNVLYAFGSVVHEWSRGSARDRRRADDLVETP